MQEFIDHLLNLNAMTCGSLCSISHLNLNATSTDLKFEHYIYIMSRFHSVSSMTI